jgi:hypothetical protein|tara:strand:+ start:1558 stop:2184 length:627 start_codon:yes stop_codon:yes gene_type:complete
VARKREIDSAEMIKALQQTMSVEEAADKLGCSAPSFRVRAKEEMDVRLALKAQGKQRENILAEAIIANKGVLSKVADTVGMGSAQAVRYHITRSPALQQVMADSRERIIDTAEDNIFRAVESGDKAYSWKVLQTLGKDRGYTERREVDQHVVHSVDQTSTEALVGVLDRLASVNPEAIEADFAVLDEEERKVLGEALSDHNKEEVAPQ